MSWLFGFLLWVKKPHQKATTSKYPFSTLQNPYFRLSTSLNANFSLPALKKSLTHYSILHTTLLCTPLAHSERFPRLLGLFTLRKQTQFLDNHLSHHSAPRMVDSPNLGQPAIVHHWHRQTIADGTGCQTAHRAIF